MFRRMVVVLGMGLATMTAFGAETAETPATSPATAAATQPAPKELTDTMDEAIKLLEAGKNRDLVEMLLDPKLLAEVKQKNDLDKLVTGFAGQKADDMLKALKAYKGQPVKMNADSSEAIFTTDAVPMPKTMTFIKVDGKWHLKGH